MFYFRLAATNIRAHKRIFVPFLLATTLLTVMNVVMLSVHADAGAIFANNSEGIQAVASEMFKYGAYVMMVFAVILAWYANSFLLKQRTKQLALYSVIGFGKRELRLMTAAELLICLIITLICGSVFGAAFSRLSYLALGKMLGVPANVAFGVNPVPIAEVAGIMALIFLWLMLLDANWLRRHRPLEMLQAVSAGEREPKTRWLMLILGVLTLGAGYAAAIGITNPLGALQWFFIAVVLVIIGTYFLFIAGSVFIFKRLRKNKKYYYQPAHFINVANMIHRMRQNGAGLASIAILATMTLVTIATTITLYRGVPQIVNTSNPADLQYLRFTTLDTGTQGKKGTLTPAKEKAQVAAAARKHHVTIKKRTVATVSGATPMKFTGKRLQLATNKDYNGMFGPKADMQTLSFMTAAHYNQMMGTHVKLGASDVLYGSTKDQTRSRIIVGTSTMRVLGKAAMPFATNIAATGTALLVLQNESAISAVIKQLAPKMKQADIDAMFAQMQTTVYLTLSGSQANQRALAKDIPGDSVQSAAVNRKEILQWMSAFLFMGILIGIMFILATALILYYKQVAEGLADAKRYKILQQVGLSEREVRRTINSQLLTLFYIPLIVAGLHTLVAAPFIQRVLTLFGIYDWWQFLATIGITLGIFAVVYVLMYKTTARVYYRIVK
ncbi:FtsX-like permease family protein [Lacticaseibacillus sharpeae]|uniref:ABC-type antimicrobial peptide transport system, permease component n=1 Tax=Lacticaseibacillus sharpeae JCM 1186 = DSM 20505 TaxID=1291052 RepID=A0A0R1ZLF4_9LACO|nr:FtsX-like permease family protein [Lacticaseibacillus sharpeae]KRM55359.1 ABC-type antimicrobial peptide transport system, permease component [Lacticaseibacillus sharpeae JCM 1186 = DSM 20505]